MELLELLKENSSFEGYRKIQEARRPADWNLRLAKLNDILHNADGYHSIMHKAQIMEAMSSSDFATLFGDVINKEILTSYQELPGQMERILRKKTFDNLTSTVRRSKEDEFAQSLPVVEQGAPYTMREKSVQHWTYVPKKYGVLVGLTWEAFLADVDDFFGNILPKLGQSVRHTRERFATELFWDASGPVDAYFDVTDDGQDGVSNLPLTQANLQTAIIQMVTDAKYRSKDEPILNTPRFLVVNAALELTAKQILKATEYGARFNTVPTAGDATIAELGLELVIAPWLNAIVTSGTKGATTWGLFSGTIEPGEIAGLKGHEGPELFMKHPDAMRVGGAGVADPFDGSYMNDDIGYKVRTALGGRTLDPKGGWASDGQ